MIERTYEGDKVQHSPLPSLAHMLDAALRCAGIWFDVTSMLCEAIDDGTPILWSFLAESHISKTS